MILEDIVLSLSVCASACKTKPVPCDPARWWHDVLQRLC